MNPPLYENTVLSAPLDERGGLCGATRTPARHSGYDISLSSPLRIHLTPSRQMATMLIMMHCGGTVCVWTTSLPLVAALLLTLLIVFSLIHTVRSHALFIQHPLNNSLLYHDELWLTDGNVTDVSAGSLGHPWLIILRVHTVQGRQYSLALFPDVLPADDFQRLRIYIRHARQEKILF